jgi:hypothetical protein
MTPRISTPRRLPRDRAEKLRQLELATYYAFQLASLTGLARDRKRALQLTLKLGDLKDSE